MITYKSALQILQDLEQKWFFQLSCLLPLPSSLPAPVSGLVNGGLQFFSVEETLRLGPVPRNERLHLIVAVGINHDCFAHTSGSEWEPYLFKATSGRTWVAHSHAQRRHAVDLTLQQYFAGTELWFQNGYCSSPGLLPELCDSGPCYPYLLATANVSPFLSRDDWSRHSESEQRETLQLWDPNQHLCNLASELGDAVDLWMVHGKRHVWPTFIRENGVIKKWMMALALDADMGGNRPPFWKDKSPIVSAGPQWPQREPVLG